jgi:predicted phage terminase large subunit-like protein
MQRLHQDDLVGHVLGKDSTLEVLSLPAIAEYDETHRIVSPFGDSIFSRLAGAALHPERDSVETLLQIHRTIGDYNFASQYQQTPIPRDGGIIKKAWLQFYELRDLPQRFSYKLQSWDTASKSEDFHDFSVCTTWGVLAGKYDLLDVYRKRLNYPDLKRAVGEQYRKHSPNKVIIEDKSSGISLLQDLRAEGVRCVEAYKVPAGSDKTMRLHAQSIKFENGSVRIPREGSWVEEYVRELTGFPGGKFDDQVDSTAQALEYLGTKALAGLMWAELGRQGRLGL